MFASEDEESEFWETQGVGKHLFDWLQRRYATGDPAKNLSTTITTATLSQLG